MRALSLFAATWAVSMTFDTTAETPTYTVARVAALPALDAAWDSPDWGRIEPLTIAHFHERSSDHRPRTQAKLLHDGKQVQVLFRVEDRYVRARHTNFQDPVYQDSCVEFFAKPAPDRGYFNLEMNCIGAFLLYYVVNPVRTADGFEEFERLPREAAGQIQIYTSLSGPIDTEITEQTTWSVCYRLPVSVFESHVGALGDLSGQTWRANFYKCADDSSHPHWGAWSDVGVRLDFHQPDRFGVLRFE